MVIKKLLLKTEIKEKKIPKHIAILVKGIFQWSKDNKKTLEESITYSQKNLLEIIYNQTSLNIPILTIYIDTKYINSKKINKKENTNLELNNTNNEELINNFSEFLSNLKNDKNIHKNKVKVSVLGKWYDLPNTLVNEIRGLIEETKDYDNYFLNFCLNYDGQEEIVDACKIISKKIEAGLIKANEINKDIIKENLYSSYFLPPDLIIISGKRAKTYGFLLWDSPNSIIYYSKEYWPNFNKEMFNKALAYYQKER